MPNFSPETTDVGHRQADEQLIAFLYCKKSDQSKHGSLFKGLANQLSIVQNVCSHCSIRWEQEEEREGASAICKCITTTKLRWSSIAFLYSNERTLLLLYKGPHFTLLRAKEQAKRGEGHQKTPKLIHGQNVMSEQLQTQNNQAEVSSTTAQLISVTWASNIHFSSGCTIHWVEVTSVEANWLMQTNPLVSTVPTKSTKKGVRILG